MTVYFTKDHEYIRVEGDVGTVGITDYAQGQLGDVVYVELPETGKALEKGGEAAVVESVKAASEVYAPVSGEVVEVNGELEGTPAMINEDPLGKGWFVKVKLSDTAQLDELMSEADYETYVKSIS
ncbi:glycine cleavage system protein GcvH [Salinarimonas ramus]|uniref:Glycine cleavage system H protein n=1 Tax=Salinarimonas ramus TaxID=690164 RepID=A0A917V8P7_9HYPH|nr:glycine cleavage system protein GcvH [Salinarimonas ramus]GGK51966.1 glycine cleavage system H protein [Salinarimonas ramus]